MITITMMIKELRPGFSCNTGYVCLLTLADHPSTVGNSFPILVKARSDALEHWSSFRAGSRYHAGIPRSVSGRPGRQYMPKISRSSNKNRDA
jgi:hypothetical protein